MSDDTLYLKPKPEPPPAVEPARTTEYRVSPEEYRHRPLRQIGADSSAHRNDEDLPDMPSESGLNGRLPEPKPGSLEASIVALRRATRDAGSAFWPTDD